MVARTLTFYLERLLVLVCRALVLLLDQSSGSLARLAADLCPCLLFEGLQALLARTLDQGMLHRLWTLGIVLLY